MTDARPPRKDAPVSLDDLFDAYERRKDKERRVAAEAAAKAARDREKAIAILRRSVVGPITDLIETIRARGHSAEVTESFDGERPEVVVVFVPERRSATDAEPQESRVRFAWTGHDFMETLQEVAGSASRGITERWRIGEVNERWAQRQIYSLVEAALKHY